MRVDLLANFATPYQVELLDAVAAAGELDLRAIFFNRKIKTRSWAEATPRFKAHFLPGVTLWRLSEDSHINPTLLWELARSDADVFIIGGYAGPSAQLAMAFLSATHRPFLLWGEAPEFSRGGILRRGLRRALLSTATRRARGVLAIGRMGVAAYRPHFPARTPVVSFPYYRDLTPYLAIERSAAGSAPRRFLVSAQLIHRKGIDLAISAVGRAVQETGRAATLSILGDGPLRKELEQVAALVADPKFSIEWLGFAQWNELPRHYGASQIFLFPSRWDGWGVALVEAAAAAMPIIASSAAGAAQDVVEEGSNGFLVSPDDSPALQERVRFFLEHPEAVLPMGLRARERAKDYVPAEGAKRLAKLLRDVLKGTAEP